MDTREIAVRLEERVTAHDTLFIEREKQVRLAFDAVSVATQKAEEAQSRVNATQNEFRGALRDQADTLATKNDLAHLVERVQRLEQSAWSVTGRTGGFGAAQTLLFQLLPLIVSVIALVAILWKH